MKGFTAETLPRAVAQLFELNNYEVRAPVQLHGAEIDLVATPAQPFGAVVYLEVTVEYVNNDKYGKDVGKLAMLPQIDPTARRVIVSSAGFSLPVTERAKAAGIETLTYDELYAAFQKFEGYIDQVLGDSPLGADLGQLSAIYEEPEFHDARGTELATRYLDSWAADDSTEHRWLVVVGEYGTGKTALTKVLQRRWTDLHRTNPLAPIPFRIELRDFARQFNADGLLHHFLDQNRLGHLPLDYVFSLMRDGRVILLLDGYDEMAQFLNARERRYCLEALARLSADGAKGIVTSRPNYFSESEELQVFEVLYSELATQANFLSASTSLFLRHEREIDTLIESHVLERYERVLRDLTPEQTRGLVVRALPDDEEGRAIITGILDRVYRTTRAGDQTSLSGKPVIVSYLFEVVDQLKAKGEELAGRRLTEWDIYELIVDQLMLRDLARSARVHPNRRRDFLRTLAVWLSRKGHVAIVEGDFRELIKREFRREMRGMDPGQALESFFDDLRSSTTLTRSASAGSTGWQFSHNSLREFLVAERMVELLGRGEVLPDRIPITDGMRIFVASKRPSEIEALLHRLTQLWSERAGLPTLGQVLSLLWEAIRRDGTAGDIGTRLKALFGGNVIAMTDVVIERADLSSEEGSADLESARFARSDLAAVSFRGANLRKAVFDGAILEGCNFVQADLAGASFRDALLIEADIRGADVAGADFVGLDTESTIVIESGREGELRRLEGQEASAYLRFSGALTDDVAPYSVMQHHSSFPIVEKIVTKLAEQRNRQRRGLEQRGVARGNVEFARALLTEFERQGWIEIPTGKGDLVAATAAGRDVFAAFLEERVMPEPIVVLLAQGTNRTE